MFRHALTMRGTICTGSLPRSRLAYFVTFSTLSTPRLSNGQQKQFRCRPIEPSLSVPTYSNEVKAVRREASCMLNGRRRMRRAPLQLPVPRPLIPRQTVPLPTPPRTWFSALRPRPRQGKRQAESTGRSSTDRLHHRGPWRAEQQQRRSIVVCGKVHGEVTRTVSGVGVDRATQKTSSAMPSLLGSLWAKDSPRSCLTELTARLLESCRRVETVVAGRSPQPTQQSRYMKYTCPLLHAAASSDCHLPACQFYDIRQVPPCRNHICPKISSGVSQQQGLLLTFSSKCPAIACIDTVHASVTY
jgi:hypothetical protein